MNRRGFLKCCVVGVSALAVPSIVLAEPIEKLKPIEIHYTDKGIVVECNGHSIDDVFHEMVKLIR